MVNISGVVLPTVNASAVNISDVINTTKGIATTGLDVVHTVAEGATGLIPAGFGFGLESFVQLAIVHIVLLFIFHRILGIFKGIVLAAGISAIMPLVLAKVFGFGIPLNASTVLTFAVFGAALYLVLAVVWKIALGRVGGK
jgi:hypothetical protein